MNTTIKTCILFTALATIAMAVGSLVGGYVGLIIAFVFSLAIIAYQYFTCEQTALSYARAKPLNRNQYPEIHTTVEQLAANMNIPKPRLWISQDHMANAFATGRSPAHASIVFTSGILELLTFKQLRGVIAHELSHIKNRDILLMSCASVLLVMLDKLSFFLRLSAWQSHNPNNRKSASPLFSILAIFIAPLVGMLTQFAISRQREYQADETGALYSQDPLALADALEKIELSVAQTKHNHHVITNPGIAPMCIINPLSSINWKTLFSTHPETSNRIARLQAIYKKLSGAQ